MAARLVEQVATVLLLVLVVVRAPAASHESRARLTWVATVLGAVGLLCRGSLVSADWLDALLGHRNWLNLVQNLSATSALWLGACALLGLVSGRRPRSHLSALVCVLVAISLPFAFIDKGHRTDGRMFIADTIGQPATVVYVVVYTACIGALAVALLLAVRQRSSRYYVPFRLGAAALIAAAVDEISYAIATHGGYGETGARAVLYGAFTPLFYPGLMLLTSASLLFAASRVALRRKAVRLVARLDPSSARPRPGREVAELYGAVVRVRDASAAGGGQDPPALLEAEALLSRHLAAQVPSFRRPISYRPQ